VVPTLPHKVIVADVVYLSILLANGKSIALLPAMVDGMQSGLQALMKSFCQVEAIVDAKRNTVKDSNGHPLVKTPNPRVELPYTCQMTWYAMRYPSLMTAVSASEGFIPFMQRLESSSWLQYYMFYIRKTMLNEGNYQLDRCFPEIHDASY